MRLYIPIKSRVISIFQVLYFIFTGKSSKKTKALLYLIDKRAKYFLLILKKYDSKLCIRDFERFYLLCSSTEFVRLRQFLLFMDVQCCHLNSGVDADALPKILREVILRASDRYQLEVTFVANQNVGITPSVRINSIQVMSGADAADKEIIERMKENDIVMTQDIPLAAQVIEKGGIAIHPRGEIYTTANVKARLHLRDFIDSLRGAGVNTGRPPPISERDKREFSSSLDQTIQKQKRKTAI